MEKIVSIEECSFKLGDGFYREYAGWVVNTTEQVIKIGIADDQHCCENWGYFITNDDINGFIGADVLSVEIVDKCLIKEAAPSLYEGDAMFINIETSSGTLQFTVYNDHNGYYRHEAVVVSKQLKVNEYL